MRGEPGLRIGRVVVEEFVELLTGLHEVEEALLCSLVADDGQRRVHGLHRHAHQGDREEDRRVAKVGEFVDGQQRANPKLGHVRQERCLVGKLPADPGKLVPIPRCLGEEPIGTRVSVGVEARQGVIEARHPAGIAAGDDHGVGIAAPGPGCGHLLRHLAHRHDLLAGQMAAALRAPRPAGGPLLILQLDRRRSRRLEDADTLFHFPRATEAGVGIDNEGDIGGRRKDPGVGSELVERDQADVGDRMHAGREDRAGEVHRLEALPLDQLGHQRQRCPGDRYGLLTDEPAKNRRLGEAGSATGRSRGVIHGDWVS